ncbi:MAG: replicative DNA helicase [Desulfovibrionaceae bacterium]
MPPQDLDAERAVLGGVFQSNAVLHNLVDTIVPEDFYSPAHREIYAAFLALYNKNHPMDYVTVADELTRMGKLDEVGGPVYLAELGESVVSAANAARHAHIVRDRAILRHLIDTASSIISRCYDSGEVEELLDSAEQDIFAITDARQTSPIVSSKDLINQVVDEVEARFLRKSQITGIETRYAEFDKMTAGLQKSDLIIVAGRPSMGKTAFALNLALNAATNRANATPTAVFSLEMSKEQLMTRLLSTRSRVPLQHIRTGYLSDDEWPLIHDGADALMQAPLFIDDTPALSTLELRARCRRLKSQHDIGLVIVDYLQLMRSSRNPDSREQEISDISRSLKALAKELAVPVIALSQLNRRVEDRNPPKPMLSDLRESGAIEQDADVIVFLYRDSYYKRLKMRKSGEEAQDEAAFVDNTATLIIGKQRNGPVGDVDLIFVEKYASFENKIDAPDPSEVYGS